MRKKFFRILIAVFITLASACNLPGSTAPIQPIAKPNTAVPSPAANEVDLDHYPLYWFGPLPPLPVVDGRPFTGSDDFMKLFLPEASWQRAASRIQVFKLYGEWVGYATDTQLQQVVQDAQRRGLALAMEFGPLDPENCGDGIEGFSGVSYAVTAALRIKAAGGTLHLLAMDEPFYYGHFYDGPNACHWSAEKIAKEIDEFAQAMRAVFPELIIGDIEPLTGAAGADVYQVWMDDFARTNGYELAFLHMDVDWSLPDWTQAVKAIETYGKMTGVPVGIIYTGNSFDKTDEAWLSAAGERVKKYELEAGGQPDHVLFQSWNDKPDSVLPETEEFTFTNLINDYFEDKSSLGFARAGQGANLALGKPVRVSNQTGDLPGPLAVDGDLGTLWNSGGGPLQWIEIDLGSMYNIGQLRLTTSQFPEGPTEHRVLGRGTSGDFQPIGRFQGNTTDGQTLIYSPTQPIQGIRFIRVETTVSPSWVAWREIEVIEAGN